MGSDDFGNFLLWKLPAGDFLLYQYKGRVLLLNGWDYTFSPVEAQEEKCYSGLKQAFSQPTGTPMAMKQEDALSRREEEVTELLMQGKSNKQIALALNIAERTVEFHLQNIYAKLGVASRLEATLKLRETAGIPRDSTVESADLTAIIKSEEGRPTVTRRISLAEIIGFLVMHKFPAFMWLLLIIAVVLASIYMNRPAWRFPREGEYPEEYSIGMVLQRSEASKQMVHGQFGTVPAWPAQPGYVKYNNIATPGTEHLLLKLRYSKFSASEVFILVYLDDEIIPRAKILPVDQGDWNKFVWTDEIDLGKVKRGVHSIKFYTDGQVYGVADLDIFELTAGTP
jgi:DNA-binding CsgD family transcriptional regulator